MKEGGGGGGPWTSPRWRGGWPSPAEELKAEVLHALEAGGSNSTSATHDSKSGHGGPSGSKAGSSRGTFGDPLASSFASHLDRLPSRPRRRRSSGPNPNPNPNPNPDPDPTLTLTYPNRHANPNPIPNTLTLTNPTLTHPHRWAVRSPRASAQPDSLKLLRRIGAGPWAPCTSPAGARSRWRSRRLRCSTWTPGFAVAALQTLHHPNIVKYLVG